MLDLQLEAFADAAGAILAQQRRDWALEHAAFVAEHRAMMAEMQRENAELRAALKASADEQIDRVSAAIAGVKDGERGPPGGPGERGEQGPPGERGIGIASIVRDGSRLFFELEDERVFDVGDIAGERGETGGIGPDGPAGRDGRDGLPGVPGTNGDRGLDGKDGRDGADGKDGLGFDDVSIEYDGERRFTFRLARGDIVKEWTHSVPVQLYRGVHVDGAAYEPGDTVTWGGSLYHCNKATTDKPISGSSAWTLAVKQGAEGKNAYAVAQQNGFTGTKKEWLESLRGPPGNPGRPGKDLTQMGPDGSKWG